MPAWAEWIETALASIGLAVLVLACIAAEIVWRDNAPMRSFRKRMRAAEKAAGRTPTRETPTPESKNDEG